MINKLYFYLTLYDKPDADEIALNHGFFWAFSEEIARNELSTVFAQHYECEPDDIQCRFDQIAPSEILRVVSQRLAQGDSPLKIYGVIINMPLPDDQRDMFINIAMANSKDELREMYHEMISEQFPGYDLNQLDLVVDEYETHQVLAHMADMLDPTKSDTDE